MTEDMIPPLCRYVIFSLEGEKLKGNMSENSLEIAWNAANQGAVSGRYFYKVIYRPKEYVVLQYRLTPMYRSAFLREHFIEPQNQYISHKDSAQCSSFSHLYPIPQTVFMGIQL